MIRLILLLLGAKLLRRHWRVFIVLSVLSLLVGLIFIDDSKEFDDAIIISIGTIVIGAALMLDGVFRVGSALVVRSVRWRRSVAIAVLEFILAVLIWAPYPIPHRNTVPFCIGVALLFTAWNLCQLGLQLRRLPPGASVTDLPLFTGPNWHSSGLVHPSHLKAMMPHSITTTP